MTNGIDPKKLLKGAALAFGGYLASQGNGVVRAGNPNGGQSVADTPQPLSLEDRLKNSIVPRKSWEVYEERGGLPVTCTPEVIEMADAYLENFGIDKTQKDDVTGWDIFWAPEMVAVKGAIGIVGMDYQDFLPGRYFMYDLLTDSIASLFDDEDDKKVAGKKIADFGGGSGIGLVLLAQQGALVTNLDASKIALEFSRYLAEHYKVGHMLTLKEGSFYEVPFDANEFDVVYNHGVCEHKEVNAEKLLYAMVRATKPGGYVVISIPNKASPFHERQEEAERSVYKRFKGVIAPMPWWRTRDTIDFRKLMEDAGLIFVKEDGLLVPPSQEVKPKDIKPEHVQIFGRYLSPEPYRGLDSLLTNWRGFHGSVDPSFRMRYGGAVYAVGQKRAA